MSMDIGALQNSYIDIGALQFTVPTTTAFSGSLNLFVHGIDTNTKNLNLFINGHESSSNNLDLFINGKDNITDNLTLFISSINVFANTIDLFIHGLDNFSDNLNLFIHGSIAENNSIDLSIFGLDSFFETLDLFIAGPILISKNLDLFVASPTPISKSINLFIKGPTQITDNINLFLKTPEPINDLCTLFINGYKESSFNTLFLKTPDNDIATSIFLHIYGSPSGIDLNFAGQEIDLFVKSSLEDSIYPPVINDYTSLFMRAPSGNISSSGYWSLFLNSDTSADNNLDLYISTNEKIANKFIDLFIARIPDFPGEEGFTPISDNKTLFLKTLTGTTENIILFVSGLMPNINNDFDCFIEGIFTINDNLNLVMTGITGNIDTNIDLFIDGIDNPRKAINLFIRGY